MLSMDSATVTSPERSSLLQPRKEIRPPMSGLQSQAIQCVAALFDALPVSIRLLASSR